MKTDVKRLAAEMAAIFLMAAGHRLEPPTPPGRGPGARGPGPADDCHGAPGHPCRDNNTTAPGARAGEGAFRHRRGDHYRRTGTGTPSARDTFRGAVSLPVGEAQGLIPTFMEQTPKDKLLVVYCGGYDCHDSRLLGEKLLAAGFSQVFVYEGGFPEWQDAGHPVSKGDK